MSRLLDALQWLAGSLSADRHDFRRQFKAGADDLRDGLVAHGWATHDRKQDRYGVSKAGFGRLADVPAEKAEAA